MKYLNLLIEIVSDLLSILAQAKLLNIAIWPGMKTSFVWQNTVVIVPDWERTCQLILPRLIFPSLCQWQLPTLLIIHCKTMNVSKCYLSRSEDNYKIEKDVYNAAQAKGFKSKSTLKGFELTTFRSVVQCPGPMIGVLSRAIFASFSKFLGLATLTRIELKMNEWLILVVQMLHFKWNARRSYFELPTITALHFTLEYIVYLIISTCLFKAFFHWSPSLPLHSSYSL